EDRHPNRRRLLAHHWRWGMGNPACAICASARIRAEGDVMSNTAPVSPVIATFFWPQSTADIALVLRMRPRHVEGIWRKAKEDGLLPNIDRPPQGFQAKELARLV